MRRGVTAALASVWQKRNRHVGVCNETDHIPATLGRQFPCHQLECPFVARA